MYNSLFADEAPVEALDNVRTSGRNADKIAGRNEYLAHRFYFKSKVQRMNFMDAINELAAEVWLMPFQVQKLLQANADDVLMVKQQKPTAKQLREKWPHIVWEDKK